MFFFLSKLLDLAVSPLAWAIGLVAVGVWKGRPDRFRRAKSRGKAMSRWVVGAPLAGVLVLYLCSTRPVANALLRSLEAPEHPTMRPDITYDAVVLLGGFVDAEATESSGEMEYTSAVERLLVTFDLLRTERARFAILSAGVGNPEVTEAVEARTLARQLERWGIAKERLLVEDRSRNTRENAVEAARVVREHGFGALLLVTSAFHMSRAAGCFRAVGLSFDTLPVDHRSYDPARFSGTLLPRPDALNDSVLALRERFGRVVYRVRGYSVE